MPATTPPVARPGNTTLGGGSWWVDTSAIHGASGAGSGTVSSGSEEWARTTQTMQFDYVRIPEYTTPAQLDVVGLSQVSACDNVIVTKMYNVATLHTKVEKIYLPVGTSAYTQFQKFELRPVSSDMYGSTYGVVSGYVMGPQGSVVTIQPYVKQEKWYNDIHTVHNLTQVGSQFGLVVSGNDGNPRWLDGTNLNDPYTIYLSWRTFWRGLENGPFWNQPVYKDDVVYAGAASYRMNGAYITTAEDAWDDEAAGRGRLINYIENIVEGFTSSNWSWRWAIPLPVASDGWQYVQEADRVVQNTYYDSTRHDY